MKRMINLINKRNNQMTYFINKAARSIPIARLRDRIIYLTSENNIDYEIVNEALNIIRKNKPEFEVGHRGLSAPIKTYLS